MGEVEREGRPITNLTTVELGVFTVLEENIWLLD